MAKRRKDAETRGGGDSVKVRLVLDLAPGTLTLEGRVANLAVRRDGGGLDVRGRLGRIALRDLVAEFRARKAGDESLG